MGQNETILEVSGLSAGYGAIKAIKDVSLHVDKGELVSLLGANGAGKSTLLKSMIGMVHIESGSVKYHGEEMVGRKSHEIIPKGISIVPEGRKIFADATVMENLVLGSYTRAADKALDEKILEQVFEFFPRLYERKSQMGGTLSGGEQQMLAIGRAMMSAPRLLLLAEPSMGLAPLVVEQVFEVIRKLKETGVTILLVEQNARMAIKVSDRCYMLNTGKIAGELGAGDGADQNALLEVYLGKAADHQGEEE
ncbi:ABC transporter ATP-binding protein [Lachnospiraceae bacterium 54-53]